MHGVVSSEGETSAVAKKFNRCAFEFFQGTNKQKPTKRLHAGGTAARWSAGFQQRSAGYQPAFYVPAGVRPLCHTP
jgi:hypothetical protein